MAQIVLVTGCRSGFGLLTAVEAAKAGHVVYAGLRDLSTADALREATRGLPVTPIQLDVTIADQREAVVARILAEHGRIDAVVNNAGVALGGFLEELDEDEIRTLFDVNVFGAWGMTRAALPAMRARGRGTIVNVSSISGRMALPGLGAYAGSKFALEGMCEAWRHELRPFGVRMVLVEPGPFKTDILDRNRKLGRNVGRADSPYARFVARIEGVAERVVRRAADPRDVAQAIVRVIESSSPRLRHPMGPWVLPRVWAKDLLPFALIEAAIGRALGR